MSAEVSSELQKSTDESTSPIDIKPFQMQTRNVLRKCSKQYKKYLDLMEESLGAVIEFSNVVTQLTYVYSDNWGVLSPFKNFQENVIQKIQDDIHEKQLSCEKVIQQWNDSIASLEQELSTLAFIRRSMGELVSEDMLQNLYILDGVSTFDTIQQLVTDIIANLKIDLSLRRDIIRQMKEATTEQMGVYASAWKYGPLVDRELAHQFFSLLENEL